jgi:ABC-type polar amino acid transport system ATPase subunit
MSTPALHVEDLSKCYGDFTVLSSVDLSVAPGGTLALLGRSGSGKSTLLRCLNLLEIPESGDLRLGDQSYCTNGEVLFEPWEIRREIGLVMQDYSLFPHMTVRDNIVLATRVNDNLSSGEAADQAHELARSLEVDGLLDRYPSSLSGGQTQRCALARALALRPKILLLDEITSALDPETIRNVISAIHGIREIASDQRMAIVLVTHLVRFAIDFADEIAFLSGGKIVERHKAAAFAGSLRHSEARRFLEANLSSD